MNHSQKTKLSFLSLIVLAASFVGCGTSRTYTQGGADASQLIKVTCDAEHNHSVIQGKNTMVTIARLDGKRLKSIASEFINNPMAKAGGVDVAYVTPGRHELGLYFSHKTGESQASVWFVAETGKSYTVRWKVEKEITLFHSGSVNFWVEEAETGKKVGGMLEK